MAPSLITPGDALEQVYTLRTRAQKPSLFERAATLFVNFMVWMFVGIILFTGVAAVDLGIHRGRDGTFLVGGLLLIIFPWLYSKVSRLRF